MAVMNSVRFTGNLGRDPEIRSVVGPWGPTAVTKFPFAVEQGTREHPKPPIWLYGEVWGQLAESAAAMLRRGDLVSCMVLTEGDKERTTHLWA